MRGAPLVAYIWWCGDEDCDCTQVRIMRREMNNRTGRQQLGDAVMVGKWRSSGWWDEGDRGPTHELNRLARIMRRRWHDAYRMIEWPWDRS